MWSGKTSNQFNRATADLMIQHSIIVIVVCYRARDIEQLVHSQIEFEIRHFLFRSFRRLNICKFDVDLRICMIECRFRIYSFNNFLVEYRISFIVEYIFTLTIDSIFDQNTSVFMDSGYRLIRWIFKFEIQYWVLHKIISHRSTSFNRGMQGADISGRQRWG